MELLKRLARMTALFMFLSAVVHAAGPNEDRALLQKELSEKPSFRTVAIDRRLFGV
jgi:hypothetical protein